jgi:hypothetical protein
MYPSEFITYSLFSSILLKRRFSHILSISKIILSSYQRLQYLISDSSCWQHQSLSSSRISLIKDIIKSKTSPKVILIIHIHLGGNGINFHRNAIYPIGLTSNVSAMPVSRPARTSVTKMKIGLIPNIFATFCMTLSSFQLQTCVSPESFRSFTSFLIVKKYENLVQNDKADKIRR